jgi:hypothetical protein
MNRKIVVSLRAVLAVAFIACLSLMTGGSAFAQDGTPYEVQVSSGANGRAGELPLTYTAEYDNGQKEDVTYGAAGLYDRISPAGVTNVTAIWWGGNRIVLPVATDIWCSPADAQGGCWCLCLKWIRIKWFPWQVQPIYIWYYDPCCRR